MSHLQLLPCSTGGDSEQDLTLAALHASTLRLKKSIRKLKRLLVQDSNSTVTGVAKKKKKPSQKATASTLTSVAAARHSSRKAASNALRGSAGTVYTADPYTRRRHTMYPILIRQCLFAWFRDQPCLNA